MLKLSQVLAVEKSIKNHVNAIISLLHKQTQKESLMNGMIRTYKPRNDDDVTFPPEKTLVQVRFEDALKQVRQELGKLIDITAQKDWANCSAKADVIIGDQTIFSQVPVTHLLFLEVKLNDLYTFVAKMSELSPAYEWQYDENQRFFKTLPQQTHKTRKEQEGIVLYDATPEHPAQTQLITKDIVVGFWDEVKQSGAIPHARKQAILERITVLREAVKQAREEANTAEAPAQSLGDTLFEYIFD